MIHTRRDFGKIALAAIPFADALASVNSKFGGVQIGAITYSFRETNDLDAVIKMMVQIGLGEGDTSPYWSDAECIGIDEKTRDRLGATDGRNSNGKAVGY